MSDISKNLTALKNKIHQFESHYHRPPNSVSLLAVSKNQSIDKIKSAIEAGQHAYGENYLQEALVKMAALSHYPLEWHFIGPIQSNKTKKIAEHFSWVHSVHEQKILQRLNDQRPSDLPPLNICLQVNVSQEITKSGAKSADILALARFCNQLPRLRLRGLMAIPAPYDDFVQQRAECHKLRLIFEDLQTQGFKLDTLSMGMSQDLEAAIAEHATIVRIGTALFGPRV